VAIGAMTDRISPWVTADSARPPASTTKLGAAAEMSCETVKQDSESSSARRRGQCAVQRTSGMVVTAATRAYQASKVPTIGMLTCKSRAIAGKAPTGNSSAVT
jgi:hypothetical protein